MSDKITVKGDKPSVLFKWTGKASGVVISGVAARDLTEYDWAAMSPHQRLRVERNAASEGGAYEQVGDVPNLRPPEPPAAPVDDSGPDLSAMTRDELNAHAATIGIEAPESFANKGELAAAIEAATGEGAP